MVDAGNRRSILLDVPRYDFNWQNSYILSEPMTIKQSSKLQCFAQFGNSDDNLANPDPSKTIKWGPQSWDEMMIGFFDVGISKDEVRHLLSAKTEPAGEGS